MKSVSALQASGLAAVSSKGISVKSRSTGLLSGSHPKVALSFRATAPNKGFVSTSSSTSRRVQVTAMQGLFRALMADKLKIPEPDQCLPGTSSLFTVDCVSGEGGSLLTFLLLQVVIRQCVCLRSTTSQRTKWLVLSLRIRSWLYLLTAAFGALRKLSGACLEFSLLQ